MIKRTLLIAAAAALSLASCRKDDTLRSQDMGEVIGFSSYMERPQTKALVTDVTAASLDTFRVMAYLTGSSDRYFETEQKATKQGSGTYDGKYTTANTYFWPTTSPLDFFAYRGSATGVITNTSGVASLPYSVTSSGDEDLVVSCAVNCTKSDVSGDALSNAQPLTFSHALTKVNSVTLKAKEDGVNNTANFRFVVTEVLIDDAKTTADYTFNPVSPAANWGAASGSADYTFAGGSTTFVGTASDTLKSGGTKDQFIILPQSATFSITYSVEYSADGSTGWTEVMPSTSKSVSVPMEKGKSYDITFHLSNELSPIIFSASVGAWTSATYQGEPTVPVTLPHYFEGGTDYGAGIQIGEIVWAPVNCGVGADSSTTHGCGLLYQWGRLYGQSYEAGTITPTDMTMAEGQSVANKDAFGNCNTDDYNWFTGGVVDTLWNTGTEASPQKTTYDPCPEGWRVPTSDELGALCYTDWDSSSHSGSTSRGSWNSTKIGWTFGDVFLPAAGFRYYLDGSARSRGSCGFYWSSSVDGTDAGRLGFNDVYAGMSNENRADGSSVRCVQE